MYKLKSLSIRANNSTEGLAAISELWNDILMGRLSVSFKGNGGCFPIARYNNYERDETGDFDYTIMEVDAEFIATKEKEVREGLFKKYEHRNESGDITKCTQEVWRQVWCDQNTKHINRLFATDYEMTMSKECTLDHSAYCRLYIAVK